MSPIKFLLQMAGWPELTQRYSPFEGRRVTGGYTAMVQQGTPDLAFQL
jgi:hypothetical protein